MTGPFGNRGALDLTDVERDAPPPDPEQKIIPQPFDEGEHRAKIAGKAVYLLMALLYIIIIFSWIALLLHIEVHYIELTIFAQLALVGIVAGPLLGFIFRSTQD